MSKCINVPADMSVQQLLQETLYLLKETVPQRKENYLQINGSNVPEIKEGTPLEVVAKDVFGAINTTSVRCNGTHLLFIKVPSDTQLYVVTPSGLIPATTESGKLKKTTEEEKCATGDPMNAIMGNGTVVTVEITLHNETEKMNERFRVLLKDVEQLG